MSAPHAARTSTAQRAARTTADATPAAPAKPRRGRGARTGVPAVPLGSLTQREHRAVIACRGCGSTRVTRLSLNLTDGTPVEFTSCHRCEHKTWEHAGSELSVGTVLDRARRD